MPITYDTIYFKRGLDANLPATANNGEPLWTTDTHRMFVGYGNGIKEIATSESQGFITPEQYGAVGDGVTDDTAAIQDANDAAAITGSVLRFNEKRYAITDTLLQTCSWEGTGDAELYADNFLPSDVMTPVSGAMVYAIGVNNIHISGIKFTIVNSNIPDILDGNGDVVAGGAGKCYQLNLNDVDGYRVENCEFSADVTNTLTPIVNICVISMGRNITICNNRMLMDNRLDDDPSGGNIWIRNVGSPTADTDNIHIYGNTCYHDAQDEAVAMFGNSGVVRNVNIHDNYFEEGPVVANNAMITMFALSYLGDAGARVHNVQLCNNTIVVRQYNNDIIRVGYVDDPNAYVTGVEITGNKIFIKDTVDYVPPLPATVSRYAIRRDFYQGIVVWDNNQVLVEGNTIISEAAQMTSAVSRCDIVRDNYISGEFGYFAISSSFLADNNNIFANNGIVSTATITDNQITASVTAVKHLTSTTMVASGNKITLTGTGAEGSCVAFKTDSQPLGSSTPPYAMPVMMLHNNHVITENSNNHFLFSLGKVDGATYYRGNFTLVNNTMEGVTPTTEVIYGGPLFQQFSDNTWFGVNDSYGDISLLPIDVKNYSDRFSLPYVTPEMFGAVGDGTADDTTAIQAALDSAKPVYIPKPSAFYKTTATLTSGSQTNIRLESEDTVIRMVSGSGFVFEIDGGDAQLPSVKHVHLEGGTVSGYDTLAAEYNPDCLGGIKIHGAYVVTLDRMHCSQFSHADGIALLLENVFNVEVSNSRFNCGTDKDDKRGDIGCKITVAVTPEGEDAFNITQVVLTNNLFQSNTRYGIAITREGTDGSIDGITIDNNGIGHNGTAGIALVTQELRAVTINNNHIEGAGTYGVYAPFSGINATIQSNQIQDAETAIYHNGKGSIDSNTILGSAEPVGDKSGIILGSASLVKMGVNNIYGTWVTTPANWYTNRTTGVAAVEITNGGTGYTDGDLLTISTGGTGCRVYVGVTAGVVDSLSLAEEGYGYTVGAGKATTGGTGADCTIEITLLTSARPDYGLILCTQTLFTNYYSDNAASYRGAMLNITDASLEADRFFISHSGGWKRIVIADAVQTLTNKTLTTPTINTLDVFADNTAAAALATGTVYRTSTGVLMVKY